MKLWTRHGLGFSLLCGHVDHQKSPYARKYPSVREAYPQLWGRIGTNQIIWCSIEPKEPTLVPELEQDWILNVPRESILRFVDNIVWNRIVDLAPCELPQKLLRQWDDDALRLHPDDEAERERTRKVLEQDFWEQPPPGDSWWDSVFAENEHCGSVSAIVQHPVRSEWVLHNPLLSQ